MIRVIVHCLSEVIFDCVALRECKRYLTELRPVHVVTIYCSCMNVFLTLEASSTAAVFR